MTSGEEGFDTVFPSSSVSLLGALFVSVSFPLSSFWFRVLAVDPEASSQTASVSLCCACVKFTEAILHTCLAEKVTNISYVIFLFIRELMKKVVKRGKEKDPWESVDEKLTNLT